MIKEKVKALDTFIRTLKTESLWDDIGAACIMAGWTNLAGALTPLKGAAPTNVSGLFQNADLDPGIGLKGNGSSKWIGTNRLGTADNQNDVHESVYMSAPAPVVIGGISRYLMGSTDSGNTNAILQLSGTLNEFFQAAPSGSVSISGTAGTAGLRGMNRTSPTALAARSAGVDNSGTIASVPRSPYQVGVYASAYGVASSTGLTDATLSWYSIGSATDLAALDTAVSTLMSSLRGIAEKNYDADALDYIRRVEEADGSYLETPVKDAINTFVVGCKKDGIWDAIKSSCIMCGARTLDGALVSLREYGPELWAGGNPNIISGVTGTWDAATQTFTHSGNAEYASYPRAQWGYGVLKIGVQYKASVTLGGDIPGVYGVYVGNQLLSRVGTTDEWAGTVTASGTPSLAIYLRGQDYSNISATLVSASIKEVINDPTNVNNNFISSDYDRASGLKGDGSTKCLDSNRPGNADGQNDAHLAVYKTDAALASGYIAARYTTAGTLAGIFRSGSNPRFWVNDAVGYTPSTGDAAIAGFFAASRNSPSQIEWKSPTSGGTAAASSLGVSAWTTNIFATTSGTDGSPAGHSDARLAFYSIGSALSLESLDTRVSTLVSQIAAAI